MSLGSRIRELRINRNLTQEDVAKAIGKGRSNVGHIENDRVIPSSADLKIIAELLGTTTDYLLGRTNVQKEITANSDQQNLDDDFRKIERLARKLSEKDRKRAIAILKAAFEDAFKDDGGSDEEDI